MGYEEAFNKLGYQLANKRQDWSSEKPDGVCITIWSKEAVWTDGKPYLDLWKLHPNGGDWETKSGHQKRIEHVMRAVDEFEGFVDVILVSGEPGEGYESASIWHPEKRRNHHWRITKLDRETGYFRAETLERQGDA